MQFQVKASILQVSNAVRFMFHDIFWQFFCPIQEAITFHSFTNLHKGQFTDDIVLQKKVYKLQPQQLSKFMPIIF